MTLTITRHKAERSATESAINFAKAEYREKHCIKLPDLLEPAVLEQIVGLLDTANFITDEHGKIALEDKFIDTQATVALNFLLNDEGLFKVIEEITNCGPIRSFLGRSCRMRPDMGHHDPWHDDLDGTRMVALSINLTKERFSGGRLQIRDRKSKGLYFDEANQDFGDAFLFRLEQGLQHRVTDVEGSVPRVIFAGWFRSEPDYRIVLAEMIESLKIQSAVNTEQLTMLHDKTEIFSGDCFKPSDQVLSRPFGDEIFLVDLSGKGYLRLNAVAARVWELLLESQSIGSIAKQLAHEYDAPADILREDVRNYTADLLGRGLLLRRQQNAHESSPSPLLVNE